MLKSYFKSALRNLIRNRGISLLNISGLAIGIAAFLLVMLYAQYELGFDSYHANKDALYRVLFRWSDDNLEVPTPAPLAVKMKEEMPEIVSTARLQQRNGLLVNRGDNKFIEDNFFYADRAIFDIFSFKITLGDIESFLNSPDKIIISESIAEKYFNNENPIGKTLRLFNARDYSIAAVFEDFPENSHITLNFIANKEFTGNWKTLDYYTYIKVSKEAGQSVLEQKSTELLRQFYGEDKHNEKRIELQKVEDIHLYSTAQWDLARNNGNIKLLISLLATGFMILVTACLNYINLTTAQSTRRLREVGLRKTLGAHQGQLIRQLMGESVVLTSVATIIAFGITFLIMPEFNQLVGRPLLFSHVMSPQFLSGMALLFVVVNTCIGIYPAYIAASYEPVKALQSRQVLASGKSLLRNVLIVFQFSVSIMLIVSTLVIKEQVDFIMNRDVGYTKDQIVIVNIREGGEAKKIETLKNELLQTPGISSVSASLYLPNSIFNAVPIEYSDGREDERLIYFTTVDRQFIDVYEIDIVEGRNFSPEFVTDDEGAFILNETALKMLGWDDPIGSDYHMIWNNVSGKVVGIMKDFNFHTMYTEVEPLLLYYNPAYNYQRNLSVKVAVGNITGAVKAIEVSMNKVFPDYPFEYSFFDEVYNRAYQEEQKLRIILSYFAIIAIIIASLGLIGLSSFITKQKTKEIGIRKVLGASVPSIFKLLTREMTTSLAISFLVAWPVSWVFMNKWLESFAYRIDLGFHTFIYSGLIMLTASLTTVSFQLLKAARANPVTSIKSE